MKSSSSSLSLSPGITLDPRELEDPVREVLLVRSIPLAPGRGAISMKSSLLSLSSSSLSPAIILEHVSWMMRRVKYFFYILFLSPWNLPRLLLLHQQSPFSYFTFCANQSTPPTKQHIHS